MKLPLRGRHADDQTTGVQDPMDGLVSSDNGGAEDVKIAGVLKPAFLRVEHARRLGSSLKRLSKMSSDFSLSAFFQRLSTSKKIVAPRSSDQRKIFASLRVSVLNPLIATCVSALPVRLLPRSATASNTNSGECVTPGKSRV